MQITIEKSDSNHPQLTWNAIPHAKSYQIFRSENPEKSFSLQSETTQLNYVITKSKANSCYYYKIRPIFESGIKGEFSAVVSTNPDLITLDAAPKEQNTDGSTLSYTDPSALEFEEYQSGVAVVSLQSPIADLFIPPEIHGKPVIRIRSAAFEGCASLKSVVIPETVITIGNSAFKNCENLESISLSSFGFEIIPESCFENCHSLRQIEVPSTLLRIHAKAFKNCSSLEKLYYYYRSSPQAPKRSTDEKLPFDLNHIGAEAFSCCSSLARIEIPANVVRISNHAFYNCSSLCFVSFHNKLRKIDANAFSDCRMLSKLSFPRSIEEINDTAFEHTSLVFICESEESYAYQYAKKHNFSIIIGNQSVPNLCSAMKAYKNAEQYAPFYTDDELRKAEVSGEFRPAFSHCIKRKRKFPRITEKARYCYADGIYIKKKTNASGQARILMTGDLMCKITMQHSARVDGVYDFSACLEHVKYLFHQSDLSIANVESMFAISYPYTEKRRFTEGGVYLNAPEQFLTDLRNAGLDMVINAQNHIYDTGIRGILETLEVQNRNQLMHTGAFASPSDSRFLLIDINGIKLAVMAYYDGARQANKRALFTEFGLDTYVNIYNPNRVKRDVQAAKAAGAEFVLVYSHFGKEGTNVVTDRQRTIAQEIADSGADFIMGSHPHCLQPYDILSTIDGRSVPVVFSAGNFLSDMPARDFPIEDTAAFELELRKEIDGTVIIKDFHYYPFRIIKRPETRGTYITYPVYGAAASESEAEQLLNSRRNIHRVLSLCGHTIPEKNSVALEALVPGNKPSVAALPSSTYIEALPGNSGQYPETIVEVCRLLGNPLPDDAALPNPPSHYINLDELYDGKFETVLKLFEDSVKDVHLLQNLDKQFNIFKRRYKAQQDLPFTKTDFIVWFSDWLLFARGRGAAAENYFGFNMYFKDTEQRDQFLQAGYRRSLSALCNSRTEIKYLYNKSLFNKKFQKYVQRDWVNTSRCSLEAFTEFLSRHDAFFGKPVDGTGGKGAGIIQTNSDTPENLFSMCQNDRILAEEIIQQHPSLAEFNASTVNTARVYTLLCDNNEVRMMMASMRVGRSGSIVDNFHSGGMGAILNPETGEVMSDALDGMHMTHSFHPDSGKRFKGFVYPHWDRVKAALRESALSITTVKNIGWDVIVTNKGTVEFVEGNSLPNIILPQATDQIGKRYLYEPYMKAIAANQGLLFPEDEPWYIP